MMYVLTFLFLITFVHCQREDSIYYPSRNTFSRCIPIKSTQFCASMLWNMTIQPSADNDFDIKYPDQRLFMYTPLVTARCSEHAKLFLCSVFTPMCTDVPKVSPVPACRSLCEEVRASCEPVASIVKVPWPNDLDCSKFNNNQPCIGVPTDQSEICPSNYRIKNDKENYKLDGHDHCGMPCNQSLFKPDEILTVRHYVGILSVLCLLSTLFTIMTYSIDLTRYRYPERPILFLSICYFILACAYVGGFVDYFYDSTIVCNGKEMSESGDTRLIVQGTHNKRCVLTFLLIYYFGMASMIWWVILTLTWFLAAGLKWGHEAIESQSIYFHLTSWGIPAGLSFVLISRRLIDGDYLTGVCYTGLTDPKVQLGFIVVPMCMFLSLGSFLLLAGFISVFKIRTVMKHEGTKTDKLERFMVRIGTFSLVYIAPQLILIICLFYEQNNYAKWLRAWKYAGAFCFDKTKCIFEESRPRFEFFMIKYTCMLLIGIISSGWVLNVKTIASWRSFFSGERRMSGSELL